MTRWIQDIVNLTIPHTCAYCRVVITRPAVGLCTNCINKIEVLIKGCDDAITQRLGKQQSEVSRGIALMYFEQHGVSQHLIHKIKYHNGEHIARYWGRRLGRLLLNIEIHSSIKSSMLIPVPMHKRRKRKRGYNAPLHIAYGIQEVIGYRAFVSDSVLVRVKHNKSQTSADFNQRYQRLTASFHANPLTSQPDAIILVDDVMTSTSTISHCTAALQKVFSGPIYAAALAFTP